MKLSSSSESIVVKQSSPLKVQPEIWWLFLIINIRMIDILIISMIYWYIECKRSRRELQVSGLVANHLIDFEDNHVFVKNIKRPGLLAGVRPWTSQSRWAPGSPSRRSATSWWSWWWWSGQLNNIVSYPRTFCLSKTMSFKSVPGAV